jgi:beta-glucanase (GH16 family)
MPVGSIPGWTEVASDNFANQSLSPAQWQIYYGAPGGDPGGWWDSSHVTVSSGELDLSTYSDPAACTVTVGCAAVNNDVSGGVKFRYSQTYGKYLVRMRADNAQGVTLVALLWPTSGSGAEIDFAEDNGASPRRQITGTLWDMAKQPTRSVEDVDMNQWHTVGVEWTPGKVVYTIDGSVWATVLDPLTPDVPMQLAIQQQTWACDASPWERCPNPSTPGVANLDVAWLVEYAPS